MTEVSLPGIGLFTPRDARDRAEWARLEALIATHGPAAFSRDPGIGGHVTGSAFVLSPDRRSALLLHHRKLDRWLQPGGHCDGVMDARATALREVTEETGLTALTLLTPEVYDIDIHQIPARGSEPAHLHYDIRYLMLASAGPLHVSDESRALAWVPLDRLEDFTDSPSVLRLRARLAATPGI